jgi:Tfp pilus assembly protein PilE
MIWAGVILLKAVSSLKIACSSQNEQEVAVAFGHLGTYFKIQGILNIVQFIFMPVAVIGILAAAIAIPKFAGLVNKSDLVNKSKESATKGALGSLRTAVAIYYSDTEGKFPASLEGLVKEIPQVQLPRHHQNTNHITVVDRPAPMDRGDWQYSREEGHVFVDCTHLDSKGSVWSTW